MSKKTVQAKPSAKKAVAEPAAPETEAPAAPKTTAVAVGPAKGRPMLQWIGKKPLRQVTAFPAQLIEVFDPTGPIENRKSEIQNRLFHGDNKDVLAWLLANGYRGTVDLVYIDPPFDSGADYVRKVTLRGKSGLSSKLSGQAYSLGEQVQYTDIWANDNYLQFMYERLILLKELLATTGTLFLHCDSSKGHFLRCLLDEVFGSDAFRNEIIWYYENKLGTGGETFDSFHDTLLVYTRSKSWTHNALKVPVKEIKMQPVTQKIDGERVWLRDENGKRLYQESRPERSLGDVWTIPIINPVASERSGYPTQKPEELAEAVLKASSNAGDLVLDCFSGSGTTAAVAQRLGRRWIACDINKGAVQTTSKRLQGIIAEQVSGVGCQEEALPGMEKSDEQPKPASLSFGVWRVNDYDLQIQHNEAVALACEHIGVQRTKTDAYFDGTLGKKLVKIVPFNHPLSPADLEQLKDELKSRRDEERDVVVVCLGRELACEAWLEDWNRLRKKGSVPNKIEVIELRTDAKYGKFLAHKPATAKVDIRCKGAEIVVEIRDFASPTILERLESQSGLLAPKIEDWRAMVDCVLIDSAYDGQTFHVALSDIPEKKTDFVEGRYTLPAPAAATTVAVKIIDMLGEEVVVSLRI